MSDELYTENDIARQKIALIAINELFTDRTTRPIHRLGTLSKLAFRRVPHNKRQKFGRKRDDRIEVFGDVVRALQRENLLCGASRDRGLQLTSQGKRMLSEHPTTSAGRRQRPLRRHVRRQLAIA